MTDGGRDDDIGPYWQAYADLVALRARGVWTEADFRRHYAGPGRAEGRRLGRPEEVPPDWSDWLYFRDWQDDFAWWWRMGILPTGIWSALAGKTRGMALGRVSTNPRLGDLTAMSPEVRLQAMAHARSFPGSGPLRELARGRLRWSPEEPAHLLALQELLRARFPRGVDHLVVMPWLEIGGAERVGVWHHGAARALGMDSAMLLCDGAMVAPQFAEHAGQIINLPGLYEEEFATEFRALPIRLRCEAVIAALEVLSPRFVQLVHSYVGYTTFAGAETAARARAMVGRLMVSCFCAHIHPSGIYDGYFRYVPDLAPHADRFVFDNSWYRDELVQRFGLPDRQTSVLHYPVVRIDPVTPPEGSNRVLWASRLDAQKNPGILARIAAALPELEFLVFGSAVLQDEPLDWAVMPPNVHHRGGFTEPAQLPVDEVFAFLYTARFDGMPNILLEMGARGVPLVTPRIGGVADYLGEDWPHYVAGPDDVAGYVAQLRALHADAGLRRAAAERLIARARQDRTVERFRDSLSRLLAGVEAEPGPADRQSGEER
ncbi:MAG: hypothetical protein KatS3mg118_1724 [Paracoccaceae bacterium]|nr:MAG: hypothetical protein KatS3mg118_1724 [Paracoccaceae bacterium]